MDEEKASGAVDKEATDCVRFVAHCDSFSGAVFV